MIILTNIYNNRTFTIFDDRYLYLRKFLTAITDENTRELVLRIFESSKYINQADSKKISESILYILSNYTIYDFNIDGIELPLFNPTLFELDNLSYSKVAMKKCNSHFLYCMVDFLSNSKLTEVKR